MISGAGARGPLLVSTGRGGGEGGKEQTQISAPSSKPRTPRLQRPTEAQILCCTAKGGHQRTGVACSGWTPDVADFPASRQQDEQRARAVEGSIPSGWVMDEWRRVPGQSSFFCASWGRKGGVGVGGVC